MSRSDRSVPTSPTAPLRRTWSPTSAGWAQPAEVGDQVLLSGAVGEVGTDLSERDTPVRCDDDHRRLGDRGLGVPHVVRLDRLLARRVGQQRKRQPELLDHGCVLTDGVDADADEAGAGGSDPVVLLRQADQLAVVVRSPVAAVEDQDGGRVEMGRQGPAVACLVEQRELRC